MNCIRSWWHRRVDNPIARVIAKSIREHPQEWRRGWNVMRNQSANVDVWIGGGYWFCRITLPHVLLLGGIGRARVWRAAQAHRRAHQEQKCKEISDLLQQPNNNL